MPQSFGPLRLPSAAAAAALALFALVPGAHAQNLHTFGRYDVLQWNTRHGLSTNVTTGLARDPDGFLWISTYSGLARFDGVRFERFDPGNTPELTTTLTRLYQDRTGGVLARVGTDLLFWRAGTMVPSPLAAEKVRVAYPGAAGTVFVRLQESTMLAYDGPGLPVTRYPDVTQAGQDARGRHWLWAAGTLRCVDDGHEVARHSVSTTDDPIAITPWGENGVLLHFIRQIGFATEDTVKRVDIDRAIAPDLLQLQLSEDSLWDPQRIEPAADGGTWLCTSSGLFHCDRFPFAPEAPESSGAERVLPFELTGPVDDMLKDDRGAVWAASRRGGLFRLTPSLTRPLATDERWNWLAPRDAWDSHTDWLRASAGEGALWLRNLEGTTYAVARAADAVTAEEDSSEGIWLSWGTHATKYQHGPAVRRIESQVPLPERRVLTEDDGGGLMWVESSVVRRFHDGRTVDLAEGCRELLRRSPDGAVWFATAEGLFRYRDGEVRGFPEITTRDPYLYRDVWTSPDGDVWVATRGSGLAALAAGQCRFAKVENGLPDNTVGGIVPDDVGRLWINSNRGVFVVSTGALAEFARGASDWLPCRLVTHVESESRAAARGEDGRLYFDSMQGIVSIDPDDLPDAPDPRAARIVELQAGGRTIRPAPSVRLRKGERSLLVRYTAPDLAGETGIRFRYRLDADADWEGADRQREVLFSDLRAGNHRFEVQASGLLGQWPEERDAVDINVPPYFHETVWFRALLWIAAATGLYVLYRLRLRSRERRLAVVQAEVVRRRAAEASLRLMGQRLISAQEHERSRIARDLHDDVSQRLALLSVELDMVRPDSIDRVADLAKYARQVSADVRGLSHALHPARLEQLGLARSLESLARELGASIGMEISFHARGSADPVPPDAALCAYRVAQEALGNAALHGRSEWASLELEVEPDAVRLTVSDGGRGFDPSRQEDAGLGLTSMRERATGLGGSLGIESAPGEGTVVRLALPLAPPA